MAAAAAAAAGDDVVARVAGYAEWIRGEAVSRSGKAIAWSGVAGTAGARRWGVVEGLARVRNECRRGGRLSIEARASSMQRS